MAFLIWVRLFAVFLACAAFGCGAAAPTLDAPVDVFSDLYVRGGPAAEGTSPRVALTFDGPGRCTADLLAALKAPGPGLPPLRANCRLAPKALPRLPVWLLKEEPIRTIRSAPRRQRLLGCQKRR